jgi:hypothetical protein
VLNDFIEIGGSAPIFPPALFTGKEASLAKIIQSPVNRGAGEPKLSCNSPDGRPADAILVGTVL